jgi:hypothetical protein
VTKVRVLFLAWSCKHGYEPSGSIKTGNFLNSLGTVTLRFCFVAFGRVVESLVIRIEYNLFKFHHPS